MKILITAPSLSPLKNVSGISSVVTNILQYNKHHEFYHYVLGKPDRPLNKIIWLFHLLGQIFYFPIFLKKNKIELVHQNLPFDPKGVSREFIFNYWCRLLGVPVMLHIHGGLFFTKETESFFFRRIAQSLLNHSKQVIVLSEMEHEFLKRKFGFSTSKVLPNSIDTSIFNLGGSKKMSSKPVLLYLGRIEQNKGISEIIEALKLLKAKFSFRFLLCGAGVLAGYSIKEFERALGDDFEYKGVVSGEDKIKVINESDVFILPSYFEGLPMALLETMADGVVPIVTQVGSMKSIIRHGINGLHIEKCSSTDLYEKLITILSDYKLFKQISDNAKKTVLEHHDISSFVVQLNRIYDSSLKC